MSQEAHAAPIPPPGTILVDPVLDPQAAPLSTRALLRWSMPTVVFQTLLFAALGGLLGGLRGLLPVYDDPEFGLRDQIPLVLQVCRSFETVHIPFWTVAVLGLMINLGVLWKLLRAGRFSAGWIWAWLVTGGVVVTGGLIVWSVFLPLVCDINSKRP